MTSSLRQCFKYILNTVSQHTQRWVKPDNPSLFADTALDLSRSKAELILENAFLRQQLIVINRQVIRPAIKPRERVFLVVLASGLRSWKQALAIVQPRHRDLYRWLWKRKSQMRKQPGRPPLSEEIVALIQRMARENRTWGAKRIRGELLKLGLHAAKSTIQRYIKQIRGPGSSQQTWRTFIHNHASEILACDIL